LAKIHPLYLVLDVDTVYETDRRQCLVVKKVATNSATDATLYIDNKPTGKVKELIAPLHTIADNLLGPLELGDLYYFIPPEMEFKFSGATGSVYKLIGRMLELAVGEAPPSPHMTRFERQFDHYITYGEGKFDLRLPTRNGVKIGRKWWLNLSLKRLKLIGLTTLC